MARRAANPLQLSHLFAEMQEGPWTTSYLLLFPLFTGWPTDLATTIDVFHKAGDRAYTLCVMVFYVSSLIIFFPRLEEEEMVMVLHHSQSIVPPERPVTAWASCVGVCFGKVSENGLEGRTARRGPWAAWGKCSLPHLFSPLLLLREGSCSTQRRGTWTTSYTISL